MIHKILYKEQNSNDYKLYIPTEDEHRNFTIEDLIIENIPLNSTYWFVNFDKIPQNVKTIIESLKEYENK